MKGSVTIFFAMFLTVVMSLLFTLVEGGRIVGGEAKAKLEDEMGVLGVFAEYDRALFERYGIFAVWGSYGEAEFSSENLAEHLERRLLVDRSEGIYLRSVAEESVVNHYGLLTDCNGAGFVRQAAIAEKYALGEEGASKLIKAQESLLALVGDSEEPAVLNREFVIDCFTVSEGETEASDSDSPFLEIWNFLQNLSKQGVLALLLRADDVISDRAIDRPYSKRSEVNTGDWDREFPEDLPTKALFDEYLLDHFSCFTESREESALLYEVEYILAGKSSDRENLKAVANRLIALREATNFAYLLTDATRQLQAEKVAIVVAGVTGSPIAVETVKYAVLSAWAYAESLAEISCLLHGGKVALVKSGDCWRTDLWNLGEILSGTASAKSDPRGLAYQDFLRLLLTASDSKKLAQHGLDLVEKNLMTEEYHSNFCVDSCVEAATFTIYRHMEPLFTRISGPNRSNYEFTDCISYAYP